MITTIFISITAFVYSYMLTQPGEILGSLYGFLDRIFQTDKRSYDGRGIHPIFKMIMACPKCVSGQMAFWYFMAHYYEGYLNGVQSLIYNGFEHVIFTCVTIFITTIIKSIYEKYIN